MSFRDYFSEQSGSYARYRPGYPPSLFEYLASLCADHGLAWDCATGSGQAAVGLAPHFSRVVATDASEKQIENARPCENVSYAVRLSSDSGLANGTVDLVTVAQALHWFDLDPFYVEVDRVLKPAGILAAWCYRRGEVSPEVDSVVHRFYSETVGRYWPRRRAQVENGYQTIGFPYEPIAAPDLSIEKKLTLTEFAGYLGTWSAVRAYVRDRGEDPVARVKDDLERCWGGLDRERSARWPILLRVGRKPK